MKLLGIIVTYFPEREELITNIESIIKDVDTLMIWDNTPQKTSLQENLSKFGDKLIYNTQYENLGIAAGLNKGVDFAIDNRYTHLLTLDQDSSFPVNHLFEYKIRIQNKEVETNDIGVFGTNLLCYNKFVFKQSIDEIVVPDTITSGSIMPVRVFLDCGGFNEALFIDAVDYEFCYRIFNNKGYKTLIFTEVILNHQVGYKTRSRMGFYTDNYSAFRIFFIVRNHIMIWKAYPKLFQKRHKLILMTNHILLRFPKVLLVENNKKDKIFSLIKGLYHGLFYKNLIDSRNE